MEIDTTEIEIETNNRMTSFFWSYNSNCHQMKQYEEKEQKNRGRKTNGSQLNYVCLDKCVIKDCIASLSDLWLMSNREFDNIKRARIENESHEVKRRNEWKNLFFYCCCIQWTWFFNVIPSYYLFVLIVHKILHLDVSVHGQFLCLFQQWK